MESLSLRRRLCGRSGRHTKEATCNQKGPCNQWKLDIIAKDNWDLRNPSRTLKQAVLNAMNDHALHPDAMHQAGCDDREAGRGPLASECPPAHGMHVHARCRPHSDVVVPLHEQACLVVCLTFGHGMSSYDIP